MRATRAYIAGFGTAGSLLAGAAMVFVLASAVVAFRGWPQVGSNAAPASIVMARPHISAPSPTQARLLAAASRSTARSATVPSSRRQPASGSPGRAAQLSAQVRIARDPSARLTTPPVGAAPSSGRPPATTHNCGLSCRALTVTGTVGTVVQSTTGTVGGTVAAAGHSLGSTVSGLTNAVASKLAPLSQGLASTVTRAGSALNGLVSNTANAAGRLVNGLGSTLGGALGH